MRKAITFLPKLAIAGTLRLLRLFSNVVMWSCGLMLPLTVWHRDLRDWESD